MLVSLSTLVLCFSAAQQEASEFSDLWTELAGTRPAQWRVVWTEDPALRATIAWSTAEPGTTHRVLFDERPPGSAADYEHVAVAARSGAYSAAEGERDVAWYHHVRLAGLTPDSTVRFRIESDGVRSPELWFRTAPFATAGAALLAGGDSRTGLRARCWINRAIARLVQADPSLLALWHGGDYVGNGDRWDQWSRWLSHHELTTTRDGRVLPILPTRGNHDYGPLFDEVFDAPGVGTGWFHTALGAEVSLLTLNTNVSAAGDQLDWLESELAAAADSARWIVTSYHRPLYPAVKSAGPAKPFWTPLFDRYRVDLSLESDGHCIKRTVPILADEPHPEGVVYVGEGGLGVPQRTARTDPWYLAEPGFARSGHHVLRLDFAPDGLRTRFLLLPEIPARNAAADWELVAGPEHAWRYSVGGDVGDDWNRPSYDDAGWERGRPGFGFGDDDDATRLDEMHGRAERLYVRLELELDPVRAEDDPHLLIRYDDGFVAYVNGREVARASVESDAQGRVTEVRTHEAIEREAFPIDPALLVPGRNVLAIVGLNRRASDRDFTLDPWLARRRLRDPAGEGLELHVLDDFTLSPRHR